MLHYALKMLATIKLIHVTWFISHIHMFSAPFTNPISVNCSFTYICEFHSQFVFLFDQCDSCVRIISFAQLLLAAFVLIFIPSTLTRTLSFWLNALISLNLLHAHILYTFQSTGFVFPLQFCHILSTFSWSQVPVETPHASVDDHLKHEWHRCWVNASTTGFTEVALEGEQWGRACAHGT